MESYASMVLGGADRNVERLGVFIAWLINNQLFASGMEQEHGQLMTRVRIQDLTGADFFSTALLGELRPAQLTETGRRFTDQYLVSGQFDRDYGALDFSGDDEWLRYAVLAPIITREFRQFSQPRDDGPVRKLARVLQFPGRQHRDKHTSG
ncbi:MAG: hypothetical protein O3B72_00530 [Proteobacteria bacterium]|nr:hypothetical protein [Pseudomonadota bacterium]